MENADGESGEIGIASHKQGNLKHFACRWGYSCPGSDPDLIQKSLENVLWGDLTVVDAFVIFRGSDAE